MNPIPSTNPPRPAHPVADVLSTLNDTAPLPSSQRTDPVFLRSASDWSVKLLIVASLLFGALVVLAGIHFFHALPRPAVVLAIGLGVAVQLLAAAASLLQVGWLVGCAIQHHRRFGMSCQQEAVHDHDMAERLLVHPRPALAAAGRWIEQKIQRLQRRQSRFFGSPDKLALAALMVAGWSAWKDVGAAVLAWQPSPLLFGAAFLVGLALGGMAVARQVDRLAYQLDLIQVARALAEAREIASTQAFSLGAFPGSDGVVMCNDTPMLQ